MADDELRSDIQAAKDRMQRTLGGGREIRKLIEHLWEGEVVERMTTGTYSSGNGLLVATNQRLLFIVEGRMSQKTEDFPYSKVSSVQWSSGLATGTITVFASGNKAEIKNVMKAGGKEIVDATRARLAGLSQPSSASPPSPVASGAAPSVADELVKLAGLREAGVLTDQEFAAQKARLLGPT